MSDIMKAHRGGPGEQPRKDRVMSTRKVNPLINAVNESIRESRDNAHRMHQRAKDLEAQIGRAHV